MMNIQDNDTLYSVFKKRVELTPQAAAYQQFDEAAKVWRTYTWQQVYELSLRYQTALVREGLQPGDHVAMMLNNSVEWVIFDKAASALGLVTTPIFSGDNADNCAYILNHSDVQLCIIGNRQQWHKIVPLLDRLPALRRVVAFEVADAVNDDRIKSIKDWLPDSPNEDVKSIVADVNADDLATIIYTSGTTGRPKGVMLTHRNLVGNAAAARIFPAGEDDRLVSFLPLSHAFERTVGCYFATITGAEVVFARSLTTLRDDIKQFSPTMVTAVPSLYERVANHIRALSSSWLKTLILNAAIALGWHHHQSPDSLWAKLSYPLWKVLDGLAGKPLRDSFGGRLKFFVSGGAPLDADIARMFSAFGMPIYQGYGLTETAPIISANRPGNNMIGSVGTPIPGVEVRIGENDEVLTRSRYVMRGYWKNEEATRTAIDADGWFHTGDKGTLDAYQRLYIKGRIKDIIVMANGEKVPPADIEIALARDPLIEQVMVYGEGRTFLCALVVLKSEALEEQLRLLKIDSADDPKMQSFLGKRARKLLATFPGYARVRRFIPLTEPWTVDNGMLTMTLKPKRKQIVDRYGDRISGLYQKFGQLR